jgi:hypothetical protein
MTEQAPQEVRRAAWATCIVAAVHVAALALILTHVDVVRTALAASHPNVTAAKLADLTQSQVLSSVVPHVVFAIVLPLCAYRLLTGRSRARTVLTVLLALQIAAHATLAMVLAVLPGYALWVIGVQAFSLVFEVAALWLLWGTAPAKRFFARSTAPASAAG